MTDEPTAALYEQEVRILARPDVVFDLLVDSDQMARWFGQGNELVAEPGGVFRVDINGRDIAAGQFIAVERPTRVVFTWGWEASAEMPPGSSTVEITLQPDGDDTLLTLVHRNCPPARLEDHAAGWSHYLQRLAGAAIGDPGPDTWVSTYETNT